MMGLVGRAGFLPKLEVLTSIAAHTVLDKYPVTAPFA
jgi:hypothetical protein